ncbi:hypothetical protein Q4488_10065 [Amphritea sp. 1_MG-2023]|uniref:nucleoside recognition domain-containing protein n=1 Tax=Amphritea sp. 1_MG-2023 TaxID=3062670 RepID=UPI0026E3EC3D|nr:nucleoside recognition domain-containing protein [Amphritea sp. 1_MG-2023]MDO6563730.1 hypothetical protein [Amphritea sp. 1_MG-2023]
MRQLLNQLRHSTLPELTREIYEVCRLLFKIMIPVLLVVKLLEELGAIPYISRALEPIMQLVGLPDSMGLVWTTTLLTNIYAGMLIFFQLAPQEHLTVAQVTVLSSMMLIAHSLPLELRIVQKAGVKLMVALLIRLLSALVLGALLHYSYRWGDWLQQPVVLLWQPPVTDDSLLSWGLNQLKSFGVIILIIAALMSLLRFLRWIHIERLMIWLLQPVLKLLGISTQATSLTIIGVTLGLSFGGGLLIREAQSGKISAKDCFSALCLLSLSHSIIEDTLLVMTLGADLSGVLWARLAFSFIFVAIMTRWLNRTSEHTQQRWLLHSVAKD